MATIEVHGIDKVKLMLASIADPKTIAAAVKAAALHVKGKIAQYPPATVANQPKAYIPGQWNTWYQRGFGSKWARADGTVGTRKSSETLGRKWTIETRDRGMTAVVGNNVSYGPFVQGDEQTWFHKAHGWKTTEQIADQEREAVVRTINEAVARVINKSK